MHIEVSRYQKPDGFVTRYWAVTVNGDLLVVTLYRKGALAVANALAQSTIITTSNGPLPDCRLGSINAEKEHG